MPNDAKSQGGSNRLSKDNAAVLMVDHQTGLFQLVRDYIPVTEYKNNVLALSEIALQYKLPTILTTSAESGPNGPLLPEIRAKFPNAPFIPRPGEVNAWDNKEFVKAVKDTGRKKLIIAGIVTDVCVAFPVISALTEGFEVYVIVDASGTFNTAARDAALNRMQAAGAILISWFALACELQRDWRDHGEVLAALLKEHLPEYANLATSHSAASK
ncbi:hypothetical protein WJX73_009519 [Symbiochloris irregularis]|uniref:Isochorismatase-like domain-containing protein n=1 Tax=Symbiochloris irregularis TaxID=706552 RepID=A0AAW1PGU6_9CHLO